MKKAGLAIALLVLAAALGLPALLAACGEEAAAAKTAPAVVNLKFSYHTPGNASLVGAYFQPWTAAIEKASGGTIKITQYPAETLLRDVDQYDGVVNGLADIGLVEADVIPGRFPKAEFCTLPGLFPNAKVAAEVYYDAVQEFCANDEFKDVQILAAVAVAPAEYVGDMPTQRPLDLKGQRVRAGGKMENWMIRQLGGIPIDISTLDLRESMQRGLIDSAFLTWSLVDSSGVKDVTKYRTQCDLFYRCWVLVMNKDTWDSLSADQRKAVMDSSGMENSGRYSAANEAEAAGAMKAIADSDKSEGNPPIYVLSTTEKTEWRDAVRPVWDRWVKELKDAGLPGQEIIDRAQTLIEKYSAD